MRDLIAKLIAPALKITGYRFSKACRQNNTLAYRMINTVLANLRADGYYL